jgi:hypothetical protein
MPDQGRLAAGGLEERGAGVLLAVRAGKTTMAEFI